MSQPPTNPPPNEPPGGQYYGTAQPGYPPPGFEPSTYGYVPVPNTAAPPGALTSSERNNAMWSYLGALPVMFFCGGFSWIIPLVIRNGAGKKQPFVRDQATESLNFEILWTVVPFVCGIGGLFSVVGISVAASGSRVGQALAGWSFFFLFGIWIVLAVLTIALLVMRIFASIRANQGTA